MGEDRRRRVRLRDVLRIDIPKLHAAITSDGVDASPPAKIILRIVEERSGPYDTEIFYCPPLPLFWRNRPGDGSDASFIHKTYELALWDGRDFAGRTRLLAHYLLWPPIVLGTMVWFTALNGGWIRRRTGKGICRQLIEQFELAARHAILPPWYYMFDLFDDGLFARAGHYLRRDETKGGIYSLLRKPKAKRGLQDKARFAKRCSAHGVRTPEYFKSKNGHLSRMNEGVVTSLSKADLFAKPSRGRGGRGMEQWHYDGTGWSLDGAQSLDEPALLEHFRALSAIEPYIVQPRLIPHPHLADLSGEVLTTVRMLTIRDGHGGHEATHAVYRMPIGPHAKVDNFHAGGLAAMVGIETGELGAASDIGLRPSSAWHSTHPHSGAQIEGRKLPYWEETLDIARRAHDVMHHWAVIGWDIAILDDGPVVIEGNSGADLDIIQRSHRAPIGDSRFGELLARQLREREHSA